jgi:hypothetical protein
MSGMITGKIQKWQAVFKNSRAGGVNAFIGDTMDRISQMEENLEKAGKKLALGMPKSLFIRDNERRRR